jgi:hypothetical protein
MLEELRAKYDNNAGMVCKAFVACELDRILHWSLPDQPAPAPPEKRQI